MNNYPLVHNLDELQKANTTFVQVVCPKCRMIITSLKPNAEMTIKKGCVACTFNTPDEWEPKVLVRLER